MPRSPPVIRCPSCGADRLIPLHSPAYRLEEKAEAIARPVAKCSACGHRVSAHVVIRQGGTIPRIRGISLAKPSILRGERLRRYDSHSERTVIRSAPPSRGRTQLRVGVLWAIALSVIRVFQAVASRERG